MATQPAQFKRRPLETLFNLGVLGTLGDAELLEYFRMNPESTGPQAFRVLVERHGPMVLSVCRSVIPDSHEAEDAFQATFLVLVHKAGSVWVHDTIGPWLYGVASRVARRARRRSSERRRREIPVSVEIASPQQSASAQDGIEEILHEEIAKLPRSLSDPVILCCLQGLSYDEAGRRLGLSEPTFRGQLHRARKRLASRLQGRGITGLESLPAIDLIRIKLPILSPALAGSTVRLSSRWLSWNALIAGEAVIPESIASLAQGVLSNMFLATCKLSVIGSLLIAGALGTVVLAQQGRVQTSYVEASSRDASRSPSRTAAKPGGPAVVSTPRKQYESLIAEYISESERDTADFNKLKTEPEKKAYLQANYPVEKKVVGRFLELAHTHPNDPAAFDALAWLVIWCFKSAESDAAAAILSRDYAEDRRLWLICEEMRRNPISLARTPLLRAVLEHNPDRNTRGRACFDLAQILVEEAEFVRLLKTPGLKPGQAKFYPEPRLEPFRALDSEALTREADHLFQRVLDEFPDVVPVKWWTVAPRMETMDPSTLYRKPQEPELESGTLADRARSALDEIRNLNVGKIAPEIGGVDVDGRPFKLSDYRGKVVVLNFSGSWCGYLQNDVSPPPRDRRSAQGPAICAPERHGRREERSHPEGDRLGRDHLAMLVGEGRRRRRDPASLEREGISDGLCPRPQRRDPAQVHRHPLRVR